MPVSSVTFRQHLHSASSNQLVVPRYRLNTYGRWTFSVAGTMMFCNSLPDDLRGTELGVDTFRQYLTEDVFIFIVLLTTDSTRCLE